MDVHLGRGNQGAMVPWVSGLAAGFPLALVLAAARSLLSGQTIGGRGLGRVCGVPLAQGELSFLVICFSCSAIFFWASASSFSFSWTCFSSSAIRSLRFLNFSWSRSNSRRKKFSEDRGRLEPRSFAATRRAVLAIIQRKLTHSPEFVQPRDLNCYTWLDQRVSRRSGQADFRVDQKPSDRAEPGNCSRDVKSRVPPKSVRQERSQGHGNHAADLICHVHEAGERAGGFSAEICGNRPERAL